MKILVAEDDRIQRYMLESMLTKWGHEVIAVADGPAAWAILEGANPPRLAILDWEMPGLTGPELCRKVRTRPVTPAPYLLLLTAKEGKAHIASGLQAGANDYLAKPFNPDELRVRLDVGISMVEIQQVEAASRELERRVMERTAELARAHANNERLLAAIPSVLIGIDERGHITRWNKTAEDVFALPASQVLGRPFADVGIRWQDKGIAERVLNCGHNDRHTRLENIPFVRSDGQSGFLDLNITPVQCESESSVPGVLILGEDRTEQRVLQAQLASAQKLESIGQLAAGVAHEINTPIQYIGDNTKFLGDSFRDLQSVLEACRSALADRDQTAAAAAIIEEKDVDYLVDEVPKAIEQTLDGVRHVAGIVRAMKEFAHPGTDEKTPVDINHTIENVITVARNEWKYIAEVVTEFDPSLPTIMALPGELNQVLLNLLVNAAHAVQAVQGNSSCKGQITFRTRRAGNRAEIQVRDTGCGIPPEIQSRVFDPFFTTKPVGKGTGQGLAIAHAVVVQRHGGTIGLESTVGHGTTFTISLPLGRSRLSLPEGDSPLSLSQDGLLRRELA